MIINDISYIEKLKEILCNSSHAVFFGGAGVSTDSGIPDFRSAKGLYGEGNNEYYLSRECLENEPEKFFEFYKSKMLYPDAQPNITHKALALLEKKGMIKAVITQNIDSLHQKAGSKNVIELHGASQRCYCMSCKRAYSEDYIAFSEGVPRCETCKGIVRPDVTLYGEPLDFYSVSEAQRQMEKADAVIVGGTSLNVFPAAGFISEYKGLHLIIINLSPTHYDSKAEYVIRQPLSEVFGRLI